MCVLIFVLMSKELVSESSSCIWLDRLTVSVDEGADDVLVAVNGGEVESSVTL